MVDWIGQKLGNYRLTALLGQGGFADVYLGEHIYLQTPAAIKMLHLHLANDSLERFLNEARIIARLAHPNIIPVLEFGLEGSTPYLVMAYAPYGTLRDRHPHGFPIPLATIIPYVQQLASALQSAHEKHIIHRDVKPGNMLIGVNNTILLSDFGIATTTNAADGQHQTIQTIGTTTYMAPEQFNGRASAASDQYSLGVIVYEWLCGIPPFSGKTMEIALHHMQTPPPSLRARVPGLPASAEAVVMRALAKEPSQRYASIMDFALALETASIQTPASSNSSRPLFLPSVSPIAAQARVHSGLLHSDYSSTTVDVRQLVAEHSPAFNQAHSTPFPPAGSSAITFIPPITQINPPLSRRKLLLGLGATGLAASVLAVVGAELFWNNLLHAGGTTLDRQNSQPAAPTATSTPDATAQAVANVTQSIINTTSYRVTAASATQGHIDLFVRGADNALWHKNFDGAWHAWTFVGEALTHDPGVASSADGQFDIFVRDVYTTLQHKRFDAETHAWDPLGGLLTSDPVAISQGQDLLYVFARGLDNGLWYRSFDGTNWTDWVSLGGNFISTPAVASWAPGRLDIFVRAADNTLGHIWFDGTWQPWESLGGSLASDPTVASRGPNLLDVFALTATNTLQTLVFDGNAWQTWQDLGGTLTTTAPTAISWKSQWIDVYVRNASNILGHVSFDGRAWQPWKALN